MVVQKFNHRAVTLFPSLDTLSFTVKTMPQTKGKRQGRQIGTHSRGIG